MKTLTTILLFLFAALPAFGQWTAGPLKDEWGDPSGKFIAQSGDGMWTIGGFSGAFVRPSIAVLGVTCSRRQANVTITTNLPARIPRRGLKERNARFLPSKKTIRMLVLSSSGGRSIRFATSRKADSAVLLNRLKRETSVTFIIPWEGGDGRIKFSLRGSTSAINKACPESVQ